MLAVFGRLLSKRFFERPIFVVGGSRSGTIALLKAMGRHPQVLATPSEDPFICDVGRLAYDLAHASERDVHYYERTLRVSRAYIFGYLRRLALESALGPRYGLAYQLKQSLKDRTLLPMRQHWCTKSFPGENTAKGLQAMYPDARFVWILRNGIDVVHSRTKFPEFRELPFDEHCRHWADSIHRFSYLARMPESTVVHQEDLIENPDEVFRRIFDLAGVRYDSAPTNFALNTLVHPLDDLAITSGVNVKEVLRKRPPAQEMWNGKQVATFRAICRDAMIIAGYEMPF
jgi:hypothetical protein